MCISKKDIGICLVIILKQSRSKKKKYLSLEDDKIVQLVKLLLIHEVEEEYISILIQKKQRGTKEFEKKNIFTIKYQKNKIWEEIYISYSISFSESEEVSFNDGEKIHLTYNVKLFQVHTHHYCFQKHT
jgi:hypothetical protein